ncbi:hypothetical protein B0H15DRAFT_931485 [Mycena belliarum]|uniref:Alpha-type protein kinase domain-containing protein n=1 Tax=Mycena belliarum TaxID=1033014 RepID=A0AAD6U3Q3_9AGAR|nr:hypothetical protein B0H15DRAFT_931485 [Mycena belliae]
MPRGTVRYDGASFRHKLTIEDRQTASWGPFSICRATLLQSRTPVARVVDLFKFSGKAPKKAGDPDVYAQEITRYADARELMEEFESLVEELEFTFDSVASDDERSLYLSHLLPDLSLAEFQILECKTHEHTWLYYTGDLGSPSFDTEDPSDNPRHRKFKSIMNAFTHFIYHRSNATYIYNHFCYTWLDTEKGPSPFIGYFQSSTSSGRACHNDGGQLGIDEFILDHKCGTLCKELELPLV